MAGLCSRTDFESKTVSFEWRTCPTMDLNSSVEKSATWIGTSYTTHDPGSVNEVATMYSPSSLLTTM